MLMTVICNIKRVDIEKAKEKKKGKYYEYQLFGGC